LREDPCSEDDTAALARPLFRVALAAALAVAALVIILNGGGRPEGSGGEALVQASVHNAISASFYSQSTSYKCNQEYVDGLAVCQSKKKDGCRAASHQKYKTCCAGMPKKRCDFPCSEHCQQQHGTMTSNYTVCCKKCPGETCVDPWELLDQFW